MNEKNKSIYLRVTPQEKEKIQRLARKCGLSLSEYLRQRGLGYAPKELPNDDLFYLCEYLRDFRDSGLSHQSDEAIASLLRTINRELILPGRDV